MRDLFRREAVDHATRRLEGDVMVGSGVSWTVLGYVFATITFLVFLFLSMASYARKESVTGWLVPHGGIIRVAARDGGVLDKLTAVEGDPVIPGSVLATLHLSTNTTDGDSGAILQRSAASEITAANLNSRSQIDKIEADHKSLIARIYNTTKMAEEAKIYISILEAKADIAEGNLNKIQLLFNKGFATQQNLDAAKTLLLTAQEELSSARSNLISLNRQMSDDNSQLSTLPILIRQAKTQADSTSASLKQKMQQIRANSEYIVTAPIEGRLLAVPVNVGQTLPAGAIIAVLTPKDTQLEAELFVPSRAAGFIRPGQDVSIQYQAFPYKKFGSGKGHVTLVSRTVLAPGEITISGLSLQEPVFRVRVKLDKNFVSAYGAQTPLQPGMLLNADIVVERRTLLQWLLDPIYAVGKR